MEINSESIKTNYQNPSNDSSELALNKISTTIQYKTTQVFSQNASVTPVISSTNRSKSDLPTTKNIWQLLNCNNNKQVNQRKRSIKDIIDGNDESLSNTKRRKVSSIGKSNNRKKAAAKRSASKIKHCMTVLDEFKSSNNDRLPTLRHLMKVCKCGFIMAHKIVTQYALHCNCKEDQIKAIMNVRSEKKKAKN